MPDFATMTDLVSPADNAAFLARPDGAGNQGIMPLATHRSYLDVYYASISHDHDSDYADISHDHTEFLTQSEIEALPGFGGSGSASLPVGLVSMHFGAVVPTGWYLLNGQSISDTSNLGLFLIAAGISSNGDGTIDLPDMRGVFPLGASGSYALLSVGGEPEHTLLESEIPSHGRHGSHRQLINSGAAYTGLRVVSDEYIGGGLPHNNMPPYKSVNFIIYGG
jgi:microcystin-dependent protein